MAMNVTYTVIDGEIISENRNGVERDYMPDPLGNTLALLDNTQTKTDTFTYWPYGEVKTRTGATATPFQYIGTRGYYQDSSTKTYVRARYLDTQKGRWMTPSLLSGRNNGYEFQSGNPILNADNDAPRELGISKASPPFKDPDQAAIAFCRKFFFPGIKQGGTAEMCMCICPEKAVKSKGYKWCNPGSSNGKTGQCSEVTPCPPGSSFVHTHPYEFPGGSGFSKGDRWFCNKRQFPLYVCSKDGTVRRIDPQPGKPGPAPPEGISHKRCCPGKVIGNF